LRGTAPRSTLPHVSFDLWFWRPADVPLRDADAIYAWCGESPSAWVEQEGDPRGGAIVLQGSPHPGVEPFSPDLIGRALGEPVPEAVELSLTRTREGLVAYGTVSVGWPDAERLASELTSTLSRSGLTVYDPQADVVHPACPARRCWLLVEGRWEVGDPPLGLVLSSLDDLAVSGPTFAVLESVNGDYVQAAGTAAGLTVEWRRYSGQRFKHAVAGRSPAAGEVLDVAAARTIFSSFFRGEERTVGFAWRDVTERFTGTQGSR